MECPISINGVFWGGVGKSELRDKKMEFLDRKFNKMIYLGKAEKVNSFPRAVDGSERECRGIKRCGKRLV